MVKCTYSKASSWVTSWAWSERWKVWSWTNIVWRSNVIWFFAGPRMHMWRSVCSKGCVCFEHNLSRIELCPCQALDICHNVITHRTDIEDDDAYARKSSFLKTNHKNNCIYLIPWISQCAIDQIKCIIQTPNFSYYDGEWNMYIYVLNVQNV